jgi:ABC-type transport system involved in multi-copper enzyme maturation permease subunit
VSEAGPAVTDGRSTAAAVTGGATDAAVDPGRFAGVTAIWVRELRGRMRGKRAFIFLTFYLGLLATIMWLALRTTEFAFLTQSDLANIGRGVFATVVLIETLVVVALAPAYTAGSISSEREKQTYDLLAVTPISSLALVVGKLLSGLSYLAMIVFASLPFAAVAFIFGGIGPDAAVRAYLVLAATAIGVGAIGIWCSAAMGRTQTATVAAYLVTAGLVAGASAAWLGLDARAQERGEDRPPQALLLLNPFIAQLDVLCEATGDACVAQQATAPRNAVLAPVMIDAVTGQPIDLGEGFPPDPVPAGGDFWPKSVLVYLAIGLIGIYGASQSISPTRRWGWRPTFRRPRTASPEVTADE